MAGNTAVIVPKAPYNGIATLTSATPITSRANITGVTGLVKLTDTSADGTRVDRIRVKSKGTSVASTVFLWYYDGTTSYLIDEFDITAVTATTLVDSFTLSRTYLDLNLPATHQLYISQTVATDLTVFAHGGVY